MIRSALRRLGLDRAASKPPRERETLSVRSEPKRVPGQRMAHRLRRLARLSSGGPGDDPGRPRLVSPLMRRILLVNALPLALLATTLLFLDKFQNSLLESDVAALREQAHIYASALGQDAVMRLHSGPDEYALDPDRARPLLLSLTDPSPNAYAVLYGPDGRVVADSRTDGARDDPDHPERHLHRRPLPDVASPNSPPPNGAPPAPDRDDTVSTPWNPPRDNAVEVAYDWLLSLLPLTSHTGIVTLDTPDDAPTPQGDTVGGAQAEVAPYIRRTRSRQLVISVPEPVIHDTETVGIIHLTRQAAEVDRSLFAVRSSILSLFLVALAVTVFLSWYLSLTIARPLRRLAVSTHDIRDGAGRADTVPERLLSRRDEIGELARSLRTSALALWSRMDANERFAADVSHEIKNPLSSIRSAIETLPRIANTEHRDRLLGIIHNDVRRLDRLITDISDASRVDAELSRTKAEPIAIKGLLAILADIHQTTRSDGDPILKQVGASETDPAHPLAVVAVEDRLVQVLRNLIGNAISFSPPNGLITLEAEPRGAFCEITVSDEGPGIPEAKLETIFDRFYSERPNTEKFGQHSGLGLAISRQIVEALRGTLHAENRQDHAGRIIGALFIIRLPRGGGAVR